MNTIHTVDILVTDGQRRVLLVERGKEPFKGKLVLPGGHIESGETPKMAAVRELHEETGITVAPERLAFLGTLEADGRDPRGHYVSRVFHIAVVHEVLSSVRAGSDAAAVVIREIGSLHREELGFDHYDAILLLRD